MESPNLEFEYGDADTMTAELSGKTDGSLNLQEMHFFIMIRNKTRWIISGNPELPEIGSTA